jgi:hypothetical protein
VATSRPREVDDFRLVADFAAFADLVDPEPGEADFRAADFRAADF